MKRKNPSIISFKEKLRNKHNNKLIQVKRLRKGASLDEKMDSNSGGCRGY